LPIVIFIFLRSGAAKRSRRTSKLEVMIKGVLVSKAVPAISKIAGAATFLLVGYMFLSLLPDLRRYIRISTM
jgi:Family of unknown function (DUF6893)